MNVNPEKLKSRLTELYGDRADEAFKDVLEVVDRHAAELHKCHKEEWDQSDVLLITYGDQVRAPGMPPLRALAQFLEDEGLGPLLGVVHILPFFPYSSDDGFSVIDYRTVDPELGDWSDIEALGQNYDLMFDLVLNHASRQSKWFDEYAAGREPYARYFIEVDPSDDLSAVVRPRSLPLLTPVETSRGTRHLWTTFSDDQLDLNFAEPKLLAEMIDILLEYVVRGARIIRLDAIAYLWKKIGTSCIHLPQTHTVVKLMRDLLDALAPGTILLTETNVPHEENFSYLGDGDEAQMVYQFSLAPLLLEALLTGQADLLVDWLEGMPSTPPGTTVLNFTASHDGVGVRPLEGIMPPERFERMIRTVEDRGGKVSTKRNADGSDSPYELNVSYFSALAEPGDAIQHPGMKSAGAHVRRFMAGQALMLSLRGMPGIYFHSLIGTPNNVRGMEQTGRARTINRRKFELHELEAILSSPHRAQAKVLAAYRNLLKVRIVQPAFHPEGDQQVVRVPDADPALVVFLRTSPDRRQHILVLANLGPREASVDLAQTPCPDGAVDLLTRKRPAETITLEPYQVAWLGGV